LTHAEDEGVKIYFSCSLTGGRKDERVYGQMVDHLVARGHEVLTAHLARPEVMELEKVVEPREVYLRDVAWIGESQALVAEVSTPSHGVGYEIACALALGKPVLCCFRRGARVSKMITGNTSATLTLGDYSDSREALALLDRFLDHLASPA
jgi:nucleoside 2-deoxyribosyltransferase